MSMTAASAVVVNHRIVNLNQRMSKLLPSSSSSFISTKCLPYRYDGPHHRNSHYYLTGFRSRRPFSPVMEWQDCTVKMEVDVPTSLAYKCYSDREAIPQWMPFISSVNILEDKPDLSRWSLKYKAFGREIEFSWLARNMQPIQNQKIHWRSLEGLPNRNTKLSVGSADSKPMQPLYVSALLHNTKGLPIISGFHRLPNAIATTSQSFKLSSLSPPTYIVYANLFSTTAFPSDGILDEKIEILDDIDKPKDSADVLRKWGCSADDLSKIFMRRPSLHKMDINILKGKLGILTDLGITSSDLVKIIHCRPRFLNCRINLCLNERLEYFRALFGSKEVLLKAIVRNPSLLTYDFHNKIKPVIAIYEKLGVSRSDLIPMLLSRPTLIPRTTLDREKLDYISRTGVSKESKMFKHVVTLFAISRIETIREKVMNLEKYGFSEEEVFRLFGRSPLVLTLSVDKVQRNMTYVLGTMKLPANVVLPNPFLLFFNLEAILKPRFLLAGKIEDMGLVPQIKGPTMLRALRMSEKRFISAFITCHPEDAVNELITFYKNAKCVKRLAESSKKNLSKGFPF